MLTNALNSAISGLNVAQRSLALVSQNVANANNPNYSRKVAQQESVTLGSTLGGVRISGVRRIIDQFLTDEVRTATSNAQRYEIQNGFLDRLQSFFGEPNSNTTLASRIDQVFAAFGTATSIPNSSAAREEIVASLRNLTTEIHELYNQTQTVRSDVDLQLKIEIDEANSAILRIHALNGQIARSQASSTDSSDLEDQRDAQINALAKRINIDTFKRSDGTVSVYTGNGIPLLENGPYKLNYSPASQVQAQTLFDRIETVRLDDDGNPIGTGLFVEGNITSGSIRGLLDLRDTALPAFTETLGELSAQLTDEINRIHNEGTAHPPTNSLTGSRNTGLAGADAHNFTGIARFSVIAPDTPSTGSYGVAATVSIDFGAIGSTITDVINAVNAGLGGAGTLALTNGVLSLTATNSANGVGILQDATTPSTRAGRGFSHFFGLNDLITTGTPPTFEQGFTAGEAHSFVGFTTFNVLDQNNQVVSTVSFDATSAGPTFANLATALDTALGTYATVALDATTGQMAITAASGFTIMASDEALPTASSRAGTGIGMATLLGFGADKRELLAKTIEVNPTLAGNSARLALARLQGTAVNDYAVTSGDHSNADALANLAGTQFQFDPAGDVSPLTVSFAAYSATLITDAALYAADVQGLADDRTALMNVLDEQMRSTSGVNIDEEMAFMIVIQNAYAASARVITVVNEMFDELFNAVR